MDIVNGQWVGEPIRLKTAEGSHEPSFRAGVQGAFAAAASLDGRLLTVVNTDAAAVIVRLNADGTPDPTYTAVGFTQEVRHLHLLSDGRLLVLVSGDVFKEASPSAIPVPSPTVFRLLANGGVDEAFHRPAFAANSLAALYTPPRVDQEGRIYIGGEFSAVDGYARQDLVRLLPDGEVDLSFEGSITIPGGLGGYVRELGLQGDGRVIAAGRIRIPSTAPGRETLLAIRFDVSGRFDDTFVRLKLADIGLTDIARGLVMLSDDSFIIAASGLRKCRADGSLDATFTATDFRHPATDLTLLPDARLLASCTDSIHGLEVFRLDGTRDETFRPGGFGRLAYEADATILNDGRLVVLSDFNRVADRGQLVVAILDPDTGLPVAGQPDFAALIPGEATIAWGSERLGRVVAGPSRTCWFLTGLMDTNYVEHWFVGRILPDGTFDPALPPRELLASDPLGGTTDLESLPDGRLLLFGNSPQAAVHDKMLERWLADGTPDPSFAGLDPLLRAELGHVQYVEYTGGEKGPLVRIDVGRLRVLTATEPARYLAELNTIGNEVRLVRFDADGRLDTAFTGPTLEGGGADRSLDLCDMFWGDLNPNQKYLQGEIRVKASQEDIMRIDAISMIIWPDA